MLTRTKTSKWMVESIYFLKPAWCGTHPAGLWPEQGLQPVTRATALRRWFLTSGCEVWSAKICSGSPLLPLILVMKAGENRLRGESDTAQESRDGGH